MMAMVQVRRPSAGQAYYRRKLAEGKSPKEALRCLKRRLSDAVYRCLLADQHLQPSKTSAVLHDKEVATTTTSTIASRVLRQGRPSRGSPVRAPGVG
jgi:transposase